MDALGACYVGPLVSGVLGQLPTFEALTRWQIKALSGLPQRFKLPALIAPFWSKQFYLAGLDQIIVLGNF